MDSPSTFIKENSISSIPDLKSLQQNINEQKTVIQSAHISLDTPISKSATSRLEKISFNPNQHKFHTQTPNYHYSKRLSTIKTLAKQYSLPATTRNSSGLCWHNANQNTVNIFLYQ